MNIFDFALGFCTALVVVGVICLLAATFTNPSTNLPGDPHADR